MSKLQEKSSALKREQPALQKMKFYNFICLWAWIRIANPDPYTDPGTPLNPDQIRIQSGSGSTALLDGDTYLYTLYCSQERLVVPPMITSTVLPLSPFSHL